MCVFTGEPFGVATMGIGTRATEIAITRPLSVAPAWAPITKAAAVPASAIAIAADFVAIFELRLAIRTMPPLRA